MATCAPVPDAVVGGGGFSMGIGKLGSDEVTLKRKFRWLFSITVCSGALVPPHFVKVASRPDISIEETEINFLNEKTWIPGKASWEAITVTYLDVAAKGGSDNIGLWDWLASVYDFTSTCRFMSSKRKDYAGEGSLVMLDGCGNPMELWTMGDMWPTSIKFGELDYSDSGFAEIELTLRYSKVEYTNFCGRDPVGCGCSGCGD